jgi:hypothetical protein
MKLKLFTIKHAARATACRIGSSASSSSDPGGGGRRSTHSRKEELSTAAVACTRFQPFAFVVLRSDRGLRRKRAKVHDVDQSKSVAVCASCSSGRKYVASRASGLKLPKYEYGQDRTRLSDSRIVRPTVLVVVVFVSLELEEPTPTLRIPRTHRHRRLVVASRPQHITRVKF